MTDKIWNGHSHGFVADKLSEVVKDRQRRQELMVRVLAILGIAFLPVFSIKSFWVDRDDMGLVLAGFSGLGIVTLYLLSRRRQLGLIGLTMIIYSLSIYLIVSGGHANTGAMWVYPLTAIAIFVNRFHLGVVVNTAFLTSVIIVLYHDLVTTEYADVFKLRFMLALMAQSGMCHILIFFQERVDDYILRMHQEDIHKLAYFDSLTQLANRAAFCSVLCRAKQHRSKTCGALIYIDLDNFKQINDDYGHDSGDRLLVEFAVALRQLVSDTLTVQPGPYNIARLGGDEFVIYIDTLNTKAEVHLLSGKVVELFTRSRLPILERKQHNVSASVGVAFIPVHHMDLELSLKQADQAMYQAKSAGKGAVRIAC